MQGLHLSKGKMTSVSIIIPAWNEAKTLEATGQALLDIEYDKRKCEVIVVAGGDDDTYEIAQKLSASMEMFARYVVICQAPQGKNTAIQLGIKEAKNKIIVLLDADTIVSKEWLKRMIDPIEQGRCDLTIANPEPVEKNWVSDYYMITKAYFLDRITTFSGHSMAFETDIVRNRLDYFLDKDVRVGVDYLLAKRFFEQGREVKFVGDAHVITHLPSSLKYFVLTELRWLTALINIDGVSYRTLARNATVVAVLILAIPFSKTPFILSLLFHVIYMMKRTRMFLVGYRSCGSGIRSVFGFILLSYIYHVLGFICYVKHFLGLSKESYLYQGQRY